MNELKIVILNTSLIKKNMHYKIISAEKINEKKYSLLRRERTLFIFRLNLFE